MARYHRVNIDGDSTFKARTLPVNANLKPGTFVTISAGKWVSAATKTTGRLYVLEAAFDAGLGITDEIPANQSATAYYVEEGREMAILCAANTYAVDDKIMVSATAGQGAKATNEGVIGYSQDAVTISTNPGFVRVRFRSDPSNAHA